MQVVNLSGLGAEISGVDLAGELSGAEVQGMRDAYANHGVIFFHDQELTPERHIEVARLFGEINVNRFFTPVENYPLIAEVRKDPDDQYNIGECWHTDHSYDQEPAMGSMLYARVVPEVGGDTLYANMYAAYDGLPEDKKKLLNGLTALHSSRHSFGNAEAIPEELRQKFKNLDKAVQDAVHPIVIKHPLSGRPVLYVNPDFTVRINGMDEDASTELLTYLYKHSTGSEFVHRFKWRPGSIAFWDNRATMHLAVNDYHGHARLMHRITLDGGPLEAAR